MRSSSRRSRRPSLPALVVLALLAAAASPALARQGDEPEITIENIRVGLAEDRADQAYKVGTWTPVRVDLRAGPGRFIGVLRLEVPDDGGVPTYVRRRVEVAAGQTESFLLYARPGDIGASFRADVFNERGRRRDVASEPDVATLDPEQVVLAVVGNPVGVELLPTMPEFRVENSLQPSRLHVARLRVPETVPDRWYGYDAVEALVLDLNAPGALEQLQDFRSGPLVQWVRNGGHLVLAGGFARWQMAAEPDGVLRPLLPALPTDRPTETGDLGAIESYVGSNAPITTPERPVSVTTFEPVAGRGTRVLLDDRSVGGPVIVRGPYGLGRVTMVGLSVDERPFADWQGRGAFWSSVLDLGVREDSAGVPANAAFVSYEVRDLSSYLHRSLEQFEGVRLVPFGWVAGFVFLYILLIGPGDYFFLKRVLGRMELTWITFPTIVVAVSLVAYATAYAVKGTDLRINRLDVVDIDQGFGDGGRFLARGTSFATLFSPQNRDYDVSVLPLPIEADDPEADGPLPGTQVDEVLTTWFGIAEDRFGSMGNTGGMALTSSGYTYRSPGDPMSSAPPSALEGVRVPIWTTKALMGTWFDDAPAAIEAELRDLGGSRLEGTLTNRLGRTLNRVVVAYGGDAYQFERPIAPGETVRIDSAPNRNLNGYLDELYRATSRGPTYTYEIDTRVDASQADLIRALSFARSGRQRRDHKPNIVLGDLDLSTQLDLGRPILLADLDGPSSALLLDGDEPDAARQSRASVLRVVLPAPGGE